MRTLSRLLATLAAAAMAFLGSPAEAGPPLICHPVEIGDAQSLPWGRDAFARDRSFDLDRLTERTTTILDSRTSALVHMETLRRAAIYAQRDAEVAARLLTALFARALDAEAAGRPHSLAWLDAGYLAQCYHQLGMRLISPCGSAEGVIGYAWITRAIELDPDDPELEFAAAMMTALARIPQHKKHVARVRDLAEAGSQVALNLQVHSTKYWPHHRRGDG